MKLATTLRFGHGCVAQERVEIHECLYQLVVIDIDGLQSIPLADADVRML